MDLTRSVDLTAATAKRSLFLFGPRQTGKSTLVRQQLADTRQFNLLESDTYLALQRAPQRLREWCTKPGELVVIDEIQKLPQLLDEAHLLIEQRKLRFLLTGSSARKLRAKGVNLLGGRARSLHLHPLSFHELGDRFELSRALHHGLLPAIYLGDEPDEDLAAYVGTYLREEIAHEALTRNVPAFARFLEVAALCSGEQINYSKIANDAQVARTTVQEYFQILRDTLLGWDLPVWRKSRKRKAVATAKFQFFDGGVVRHLRGTGRVKSPSPEFGHQFEGWVGHELKTWCDYRGKGAELCFWRSQSDHEVDYVVGDAVAVEVKATTNVSTRDVAGLAALREEALLNRHVVVCQEARRRVVDGIEILPWQVFADELWNDRLVDA
ncbi:MAG: AAA family ATPase [Planctomycetota bacterium]